MLYTFELTEDQLDRVSDYLATLYAEGSHQYILGVQHRITDDLIWVIVDCSQHTAIWIGLAIL